MLVALTGYTLLCTPAGWRVHNHTSGDLYAAPAATHTLCWVADGGGVYARLYAQCPVGTVYTLTCEVSHDQVQLDP